MKKVKIYGAGSIGNHLSHASRQMGWEVDLCDLDSDALVRTKNDIYPSRYGKWDKAIGLYLCSEAPKKQYDLHVIGTPPDSHISLVRSAVKEGAKAVLVEKPLCTPDLNGAQQLFEEANEAGCTVFVGYDHAVGKSATRMADYLMSSDVGEIQTLDVEFREHWGGIFKAHPWLNGPADTYLGYWERGGGACGDILTRLTFGRVWHDKPERVESLRFHLRWNMSKMVSLTTTVSVYSTLSPKTDSSVGLFRT